MKSTAKLPQTDVLQNFYQYVPKIVTFIYDQLVDCSSAHWSTFDKFSVSYSGLLIGVLFKITSNMTTSHACFRTWPNGATYFCRLLRDLTCFWWDLPALSVERCQRMVISCPFENHRELFDSRDKVVLCYSRPCLEVNALHFLPSDCAPLQLIVHSGHRTYDHMLETLADTGCPAHE